MRQNIQLTLPFTWDSSGESGGAHEEGIEARTAQLEPELPARVPGIFGAKAVRSSPLNRRTP